MSDNNRSNIPSSFGGAAQKLSIYVLDQAIEVNRLVFPCLVSPEIAEFTDSVDEL